MREDYIKKRNKNMIKSIKLRIFIFSLLLVLASILLFACGNKDYTNVTVTSTQDSIELFAREGEVENITFTINNPVSGMSNKFTYYMSNPGICNIEQLNVQGYSTTYSITGLKGGVSDLTVTTDEGNVTKTVQIIVHQYSDIFQPASNALYTTATRAYTPSANDFKFSENTTERQLQYYFYGKVAENGKLSLSDISNGVTYQNNFVKVELFQADDDNNYLIFTDAQNQYFTLGSALPQLATGNTKYNFLSVTKTDDGFSFNQNQASSVAAGDEFAFVATYNNDLNEELFCERSFSVLIDIKSEDFSHYYGYHIDEVEYTVGSDNSYVMDEASSQSSIYLMPNSAISIDDGLWVGNTAELITVYLEITMSGTNNLLQSKFYVDNENVINAKYLGNLSENGYTTYYYQVNCNTGVANTTNFNVNFYYDGFENSNDEKVNFVYSIPVVIRILPNNLLVNNIDLDEVDRTYTFYNNYAGESFGWQEFNFTTIPQDANITELTIDLTGSGLQVRYRNTTYTNDIVHISDLSSPVYIKGIENAPITIDARELPIDLYYPVLTAENSGHISTAIKYQIVQGATTLDFATDEFEERVYLDISNTQSVTFNDIFADAQFSNISFSLIYGDDVARFTVDRENIFIPDGARFLLNFEMRPIAIGTGTYAVELDNGTQTAITITVEEGLNSVTLTTQNPMDAIKYSQNITGDELSTLFFVYNNPNVETYFDIDVIGNNNPQSNSINDVQVSVQNQLIAIGEPTDNNKHFNVYTTGTGTSRIELSVRGREIINFISRTKTIVYYIDIVSFDYIGSLDVYKEMDGFGNYLEPSSPSIIQSNYGVKAAYADVYSNTNLVSARTAKFNISVQNPDAYLFATPESVLGSNLTFSTSNFNENFVYWESDAIIQQGGNIVKIMYRSPDGNNIYNIGGYGTFDTSTWTFTAEENIQNRIDFKLIAHVRQYDRLYSFTVNVRISIYQEVAGITAQQPIEYLEFSSTDRVKDIIVYPTNPTATNGEIVALFFEGTINVDGTTYSMLDENSMQYIESDGKYQIIMTVKEDFVTYAETYEGQMKGRLMIVAKDWLDSGNNLQGEYQDFALIIDVYFANGTEQNRFTLENADDLVNMNLSAHYKISTSIDASSISDKLPLGRLNGSIIGTNEYAQITGINITNAKVENDQTYYGVFTEIGENAYIEYITFQGEFNIGNAANTASYAANGSYIGLVAGVNHGNLINIGAEIDSSVIYLRSGYVGGVIGYNDGSITIDYTLYESADSNTRSFTKDQLANGSDETITVIGKGRSCYDGYAPKIFVFMNGTLNVKYAFDQNDVGDVTTSVGGGVGYNGGTIKKIDSKVINYSGYNNYAAYSLLTVEPVATTGQRAVTNTTYVGGFIGRGSDNGELYAGYNSYENQDLDFVQYLEYENPNMIDNSNDYTAGEGIIVGGEVIGYDFVGGVVGYIDQISNNAHFSGITSRTQVRGLLNNLSSTATTANVAGIAYIAKATTISSALAMQAVDNGKTGTSSSMLVIHNDKNIDAYFGVNNGAQFADSDKLAFGISPENRANVMYGNDNEPTEGKNYTNVTTYLTSRQRRYIENETSINNIDNTMYHGDFIIVGDNGTRLLGQSYFADGSEDNLSLNPAFNNQLEPKIENTDLGKKEIFYMFFFEASTDTGTTSDIQNLLNTSVNSINSSSKLYPFTINGEMTFTSRTRDVLTIDSSGKITVKKTGLAQISGTSVLNVNNSLDFYIYVVNYFNPDEPAFAANAQASSIIYPNGSAGSGPIENTTIKMRGESTATLYVRPHYTLDLDLQSSLSDRSLTSDSFGNAMLDNFAFALTTNTSVTAELTDITRIITSEGGETTTVDANDELDIDIQGQTITLRKNDKTVEGDYKVKIIPKVTVTFNEFDSTTSQYQDVEYCTSVNRILDNVTINYRKGAISIHNSKYNSVPLLSSKKIEDVIIINSTAVESNPYYYIVGPDNTLIQGSAELREQGFSFKYDMGYVGSDYDNQFLFNVTIKSQTGNADNLSAQKFDLVIEVNKTSDAFLNRYTTDIYGTYKIFLLAQSNTGIYLSYEISFEKTNIVSVVVDNYSNLSATTGEKGLSTTSRYAYPGTSGLLAISVTPEDSDFDYILIENSEDNYQSGNAVANFGFLARLANPQGEGNIFDDSNILGSSGNGLKINLEDIVDVYNNTTEGSGDNEVKKYYQFNGVIYIKYDLNAENVVDGSISKIVISLYKDGERYSVTKELTVKLQNYVAVSIDGKTPTSTNTDGYYANYVVARGMRYKLNIDSYGFEDENISAPTLSTDTLATITEENGEYYLNITENAIDYSTTESNVFSINISATRYDGDISHTASSTTRVVVQEYVLNYNGEIATGNEDIISGMGDGVINMQVGTQTTFAVELYDYIEYDTDNIEVQNKIDSFFASLAQNSIWHVYTNLISPSLPDYSQADEDGLTFDLGYQNGTARTNSNYYFNSNGLNFIPVRTHTPEERFYYIEFRGQFEQTNGAYSAVDITNVSIDDIEKGSNIVSTSFVMNVYTSSSEESPIPIYDYEDFIDMQLDGYYILLNDIVLPNKADEANGIEAFTPQTARFKSFDGNGHTIYFAGAYDMGSQSSLGLFTTLNEDSIVKNLNVSFTAANDGSDINVDQNDDYGLYGLRTVKFITSADAFYFGAIAAENSGIITNCKVYTDKIVDTEYYITVRADNALRSSSYIGGITANNSGYITNCQVSANFKSPYNMSGIAAQNSNKIAACSFKGGKIINNSRYDQHAAGLVVRNLETGQIITSFVSGEQSNTSIYSKDKNSAIISTIAAAGFVYENNGNISDCYTDIDLSQTTSDMAGFVYTNGGLIKNSFSLSTLRNNVTASAAFARYDVLNDEQGTFKNCYYFYNIQTDGVDSSGEVNDDGFIVGEGNINTSVIPISFEGVTRLNAGGFANLDEYFLEYSYQKNMNANAVWFFSTGNTSSTFVKYTPTSEKIEIPSNDGEENKTQINTVYRTSTMVFGLNRLELTSANIDVLSVRNFSYSELNENTGDVQYFYVDDSSAPNRGTLHNPRLISDASTMESEISQQTSAANLNTTNYRIVSDIDYGSYEGLSSLYQTTFAGVLEGNGMQISQISLVSMSSMQSAGLFAQIGYSSVRTGTVKNLTIAPRQVAFSNTNSVGTLAGTLRYGYIYDVTVDGNVDSAEGTSLRVVSGLNFVGGVVGRAVTSFEMKNISSNINVSSSYTSTEGAIYSESSGNLSHYSYAGSIAGYLGNGVITEVTVQNVSTIMGSRAGFVFGGIGRGGRASHVFTDVALDSAIRAYHYGGFIAGEIQGSLNYAHVSNNLSNETTFEVVPRAATAVGGISGLLAGGSITNAVVEQAFTATAVSNSNTVISYVGGIVGRVSGAGNYSSTITSSMVTSNITGASVVGGAVGQVENALTIKEVAVKSPLLTLSGQKSNPYLGGIVGNITNDNNSSLSMYNSYSTSNLVLDTATSGVTSQASVGGLIGNAMRTPNLAYCYTTSTVTATVVDLRGLGTAVDFSEIQSTAAGFSYSIDDSAGYDNVYYFGHNESGDIDGATEDLNIYTTSRNYGISFATKVKDVQISLKINNYGKSSQSYVEEISGQESAAGQNQNIFYNIFGSKYFIDQYSTQYEDIYYNHINDTYVQDNDTSFAFNISSGQYEFTKAIQIAESGAPVNADDAKYLELPSTSYIKTEYIDSTGKIWEYQKLEDNYSSYVSGSDSEDTLPEGDYTVRQTLILTNDDGSANDDGMKGLLRQTVYCGSDGNYYRSKFNKVNGTTTVAIENITTGVTLTLNDDGNFVTSSGAVVFNKGDLTEVWSCSKTSYSNLAFENNLAWTQR